MHFVIFVNFVACSWGNPSFQLVLGRALHLSHYVKTEIIINQKWWGNSHVGRLQQRARNQQISIKMRLWYTIHGHMHRKCAFFFLLSCHDATCVRVAKGRRCFEMDREQHWFSKSWHSFLPWLCHLLCLPWSASSQHQPPCQASSPNLLLFLSSFPPWVSSFPASLQSSYEK